MPRPEATILPRPDASSNPSGARPARWVLGTALAASTLVLTGCAINRPEARATAASIVESRNDVTRLAIDLELTNTGKDEIELVEYDYTVTLADGARYGGKWAALRALPPGEPVRATIPAVVPAASAQAARGWSVNGSLRYRDPRSVARILYEAGILKPEVSFSGSGSTLGEAATAAATTPTAAPADTSAK